MATPTNRANTRRATRINLTPRGELIGGGTSIKVLLQDVSDEGFLLLCSREFEPGEVYELKFQISPGSIVECSVEVRHSSEMGTGVKIVSINEQSRRVLAHFLEEHFSHHLGRLG
jgi:hypothetical protein